MLISDLKTILFCRLKATIHNFPKMASFMYDNLSTTLKLHFELLAFCLMILTPFLEIQLNAYLNFNIIFTLLNIFSL